MDRESVREFLKELAGPNVEMKNQGDWISTHCILAPWEHSGGTDANMSFGVKVNDNGNSIYNCLAGSTEVVTSEGIATIAELSGSTKQVITPQGLWTSAKFSSYGLQRLYEIRLSRNGVKKTIYATNEHRWFAVKEGATKSYECTTGGLRPGVRLASALPSKRSCWSLDPEGVKHGIVFGDGTRYANNPATGAVALFGGKAIDLQQWFVEYRKKEYKTTEGVRYLHFAGAFGSMKELPDASTCDDSYLLGVLAGYVATDGCVAKGGDVTLNSSVLANLVWVRDTCYRLGIATFGITTRLRKGFLDQPGETHDLRFVGSQLDDSFFLLSKHRSRFAGKRRKYERLRWSVVAVRRTNRVEEVYCAEVPKYHAFTLEGNILTGNCLACHNKGPLESLLQKLGRFSGEDYSSLVEQVGDGEFLSSKLPEWGARKSRKITLGEPTEDIMRTIYDPAAGHPYLDGRGINSSTANELDLRVDPKDSRGEERILFPIHSMDGAFRGFTGRAVRRGIEPKVRDYFGLQKRLLLLGEHDIYPSNDILILVEGLFDYARLKQFGYDVVASMHSQVTEYQARTIVRLGKPVYVFFDNDKAGILGRKSVRELIAPHLPTFKVKYPDHINDPGQTSFTEDMMHRMVRRARLL